MLLNYMKFKPLITERLIIRPLEKKDCQRMSKYRSLPEVAKYQSWNKFTDSDSLNLIREVNYQNVLETGKWIQFGVEVKEGGVLIGDIGFFYQDECGISWIGFTLDSKFWGKGYAFESVDRVLSYYTDLGVKVIRASIDPKNISSKKLLEKLRFHLIESGKGDLVLEKN